MSAVLTEDPEYVCMHSEKYINMSLYFSLGFAAQLLPDQFIVLLLLKCVTPDLSHHHQA